MHRARWSIILLFVALCGGVLGPAPCQAGLLSATEGADDDCCEARVELDLCGDTCAGCSEYALIQSSESSDKSSPSHQDQTPVLVPLHVGPVSERAAAIPIGADTGLLSSPDLPAHLSSTVLLR